MMKARNASIDKEKAEKNKAVECVIDQLLRDLTK